MNCFVVIPSEARDLQLKRSRMQIPRRFASWNDNLNSFNYRL